MVVLGAGVSSYTNSDFDTRTTSGTYYSGKDACVVYASSDSIIQLAFSLKYTGEIDEVISRAKLTNTAWSRWKRLYKLI